MRLCPLCGADQSKAATFMAEHLDPARLTEYSFASRKVPEFMNHRLMRCRNCDLVYVPERPAQDELARAYHTAGYDSAEEATDAARSYCSALRPILAQLPQRRAVLEIGAGTGALLDLLAREGFTHLVGVEPSAAALNAAPDNRRRWLRLGTFDESQFQPETFDLVCCMMTMEHVADPKLIAQSAFDLLRPGGSFVTVTHDYRSAVNRILGRKSPIIDIEHMQLFSRRSITRLFRDTGYTNVTTKALANSYSMSYWLRLSPLPARIKANAGQILIRMRASRINLRLNVGNVIASGFKR